MVHRSFPTLVLPLLLAAPVVAQATTVDDDGLRRIVRGTHDRLVFDEEVVRIAVGDPELMSVESITSREVLVRGREIGRTSIVVWFEDGGIESSQWVIQPDLRVLQRALSEIDPSITARIAPDRDAIVLRGEVPEVALALQAEAITADYLQVGEREEDRDPRAQEARAEEGEAFPDEAEGKTTETLGATASRTRQRSGRNRSAVINLIRYPTPAPTPIDDRIEAAISSVAGPGVVVRRIPVGPSANDAEDLFLLEGAVPDQIALTRILHLAGRVLVPSGRLDVEVVADESGALADRTQNQRGQGGQQGGGLTSSVLSDTGSALQNLRNRIEANIGRGTVLSTANGRILSFLQVRDQPQVRLTIQFYEVNRTQLRSRGIDATLLGANFDEPSLLPGGLATNVQGTGAATIDEDDVQGLAGWINGAFAGQVQVNAGRFAMDAILNYLETQGVARSLSQPSMIVLSGETALFQVGGEVPLVSAVGNNSFVGVGVTFREFGVQLAVRPLVSRDGYLTLDLAPEIVLPDPALTADIVNSTGGPTETTAFSSRTLQTTARVRDGEVMLLGGLMSRMDSEDSSKFPGFSSLPLIGWAFDNESRNSDEVELVIVISPVVQRDKRFETELWESPSSLALAFEDLLRR